MSPSRPLLLVTATVHLDSQWRWTVRDTIAEFLPRTLRENFALFRSHPSYVLSFEGAFRYMLVQEYYPEAFEELRHWCREGRWVPVGAMLDAPDVNVVSPESLIRQILYGKRFFERELGVRCRDVFLPDCFGFGHALPSVAAHCGLDSFSTSKLLKWKAPGDIPFDLGRWRGPDGAEILAVLKPGGYGEGIEEDLSHSAEWLDRLTATGERCGVAAGMRYFGTGDRGGSPDRASLDRLESSVASDGPIEVRCRASDAIQDEIDHQALARLPLHDSEILLPTHGTGCWTSQAGLKRWNRKNELLATAAEGAAVVADWLGELDYPRLRIDQGWLRFLWHQMHDDLPGTSIPSAYEITWNDEAIAANLFAGVLSDSVAAVAERLDTSSSGLSLVLYNPTGHLREDVVEAELDRAALPAGDLQVVSPTGEPLPVQIESSGRRRVRLLFRATVRPLSFSVFQLCPATTGKPPAEELLQVSTRHLENHRYRVTVGDSGDVDAIFDKRLGRDLLRRPLRLELLRDRSARWPAWEIRPESILEARAQPVTGTAIVTIVESGPVRVALEIERRFAGSRLRQTLRLASGGAGDRLEICNDLDWRTRGRLLKVAFPLAAASPRATYDLGFGAISRDNNSADRYEVPAQQWAELTDESGDFGAAILNDSSYGWDKPSDDELRLSLVRSPSSLRKYPHQRTQDLGRHRFTYAIVGHAGRGERAEICRQAEGLNQPLLVFAAASGPGDLGREMTFLESQDAHLSIMALKKAEDGGRYVVRLRDLEGAERGVRLKFPVPVRAAARLGGDERHLADLTPTGDPAEALDFELRPWAVETLDVEIESLNQPERTLGQQAVELTFNRRTTSLHGEPASVDFDGLGSSIPGELFPEVLRLGAVEYRLGSGDDVNALRCEGQRIELPSGYRHLWLLVASTGAATAIELTFGGDRHTLLVAPWTGYLARRARPARWGGFRRATTGHLITDELAWLGTHRHRRGRRGEVEDEPYRFCYLFRHRIELAPEATELQLPHEPHVHLFAATAVADGAAGAKPLQALYGV